MFNRIELRASDHVGDAPDVLLKPQGVVVIGARRGARLLPWMLMALSSPVVAAPPIDLSQLCGPGDCVVATNTTIGSAGGALSVGGNFTVNPGVVLQFLVPVRINVAGNMVLAGTVGAPGNGGDGGAGGGPGQQGGAGGSAPPVVDAIFDVRGTITLDASAAVVAEGGGGGSGGLAGVGQITGGAGGAGGKAGSLTFNTCSAFTSAAGARVLTSGGPGGIGEAGASGGAGGAGGTVTINAFQTIASNALITALGGVGGNGGAGTGANGADGSITLRALGAITVGAGSLNSGNSTPSVNQSQTIIPALASCVLPAAVPTLSAWALLLLAALMAMFSVQRMRRRFASRSNEKSGV